MYLFCYGANMSHKHLNKLVKYNIISKCVLKNYKLVFNHFGFYGNIKREFNQNVFGILIEIDKDNLNKLKKNEFMYKLTKIKVYSLENNATYNCLAFKSLFTPFELGALPKYEDKIKSGFRENNMRAPVIKKFNYYLLKLIINTIGFMFGLFLFLFTKFKFIGLILFLVDLSMVIDQILNSNFYNKFSSSYPRLFFTLFKIIPTFIIVPYLFIKGNFYLKLISIGAFLVDIQTLIKFYIEM